MTFLFALFNSVFIGISGRIKWKGIFLPFENVAAVSSTAFCSLSQRNTRLNCDEYDLHLYSFILKIGVQQNHLGILQFIRNNISNSFSQCFDQSLYWDNFSTQNSEMGFAFHFLSTMLAQSLEQFWKLET